MLRWRLILSQVLFGIFPIFEKSNHYIMFVTPSRRVVSLFSPPTNAYGISVYGTVQYCTVQYMHRLRYSELECDG